MRFLSARFFYLTIETHSTSIHFALNINRLFLGVDDFVIDAGVSVAVALAGLACGTCGRIPSAPRILVVERTTYITPVSTRVVLTL